MPNIFDASKRVTGPTDEPPQYVTERTFDWGEKKRSALFIAWGIIWVLVEA